MRPWGEAARRPEPPGGLLLRDGGQRRLEACGLRELCMSSGTAIHVRKRALAFCWSMIFRKTGSHFSKIML